MKYYNHPYGGLACDQTFPRDDVEKYFNVIIPTTTTPQKVWDFMSEGREVLIYTTRDPEKVIVTTINKGKEITR